MLFIHAFGRLYVSYTYVVMQAYLYHSLQVVCTDAPNRLRTDVLFMTLALTSAENKYSNLFEHEFSLFCVGDPRG